VPATTTRAPLPPTLRAWLQSSNPATVAYLGASGLFTVATIGNVVAVVRQGGFGGGHSPGDIILLATLALAPMLPLLGFHLNQARRLFRAGHTLADLRTALDVAARERSESEALTAEAHQQTSTRLLRNATWAAGTWSAVTLSLGLAKVIHERMVGPLVFVVPIVATVILGAACNVLEVPLVPDAVRSRIKPSLRERLWRSRVGAWLARRLGAPERSAVAGAAAFRATEAALGVAASELYAALPKAYREELSDLPAIVSALEARAAEARAEIEEVDALAASANTDAGVLHARRESAASQLAESVAALEGIRLDLLRLHSGGSDLAPITTLMDAARGLAEDVGRLADAHGEVERVVARISEAG
jgi:serine/threonine-protein kinase